MLRTTTDDEGRTTRAGACDRTCHNTSTAAVTNDERPPLLPLHHHVAPNHNERGSRRVCVSSLWYIFFFFTFLKYTNIYLDLNIYVWPLPPPTTGTMGITGPNNAERIVRALGVVFYLFIIYYFILFTNWHIGYIGHMATTIGQADPRDGHPVRLSGLGLETRLRLEPRPSLHTQ